MKRPEISQSEQQAREDWNRLEACLEYGLWPYQPGIGLVLTAYIFRDWMKTPWSWGWVGLMLLTILAMFAVIVRLGKRERDRRIDRSDTEQGANPPFPDSRPNATAQPTKPAATAPASQHRDEAYWTEIGKRVLKYMAQKTGPNTLQHTIELRDGFIAWLGNSPDIRRQYEDGDDRKREAIVDQYLDKVAGASPLTFQ